MRRWIVLVLLLLLSSAAAADTWMIADERRTIGSPDGAWLLVIEKGRGYPKRHQASLHRSDLQRPLSQFTLVNSPIWVLVSNQGAVVTIDTCCRKGYGDAVVVIYRRDGKVVRQMSLLGFLLSEDVAALDRTVSSIDWDAAPPRIDEEARELVLQVQGPPARSVEVRVSLETGLVLEPIKRHFWRAEWTHEVTYGSAPAAHVECAAGRAVSSDELLSQVAEAIVPTYPAIARRARIHGSVIVELSANGDGIVDHVAVVKPLPFGIDQAALAAVRQWRFRPGAERMCGQISLNFVMTEVPPPILD